MSVQSVVHEGREILYCFPDAATQQSPVLLVHGAFAGAWMWEGALLALAAAGYPAVAISLRGHGGSEGHDRLDWLSIDDYVEDVAVACAWLQGQSDRLPILVGHSMGGFIAQKFLEHHRAAGLALMCSVPPQGLLASQFYLMFRKPGLFIQLNQILEGKIPDARLVRDALFAGEVSDAVVEDFLRHTQRESQRAIWDMSLFNLMGLGVRELPPILVMGAERDVLIPAFLVRATARTYGTSPIIYPESGHALTHEKIWPQVCADLMGWLRGLSAGAAA